jgi:hypothetical protein
VNRLHAESTVTSGVLALSVGVAVVGHALAGGAVATGVLPQLLALAAACWLLGSHLAGRRDWAVVVLAAIQLFAHFALDSAHPAVPMASDHAMAGHGTATTMAHGGIAGSLTMATAHLVVLLVGVGLIDRTHQWVLRVRRIVARLVPALPMPVVALPVAGRALGVTRAAPRPRQRWSTSNVSRRGPPGVRDLSVLS